MRRDRRSGDEKFYAMFTRPESRRGWPCRVFRPRPRVAASAGLPFPPCGRFAAGALENPANPSRPRNRPSRNPCRSQTEIPELRGGPASYQCASLPLRARSPPSTTRRSQISSSVTALYDSACPCAFIIPISYCPLILWCPPLRKVCLLRRQSPKCIPSAKSSCGDC